MAGIREGDTITLQIPEDLPAQLHRGTEIFKLFATEEPTESLSNN